MSTIKIQIRTANKKVLFVEVNKNESIQSLKLEIEKQTQIAVLRQRLLYRGRELNNNKPISDYGVDNGSIIQLATIRAIRYVVSICMTYLLISCI